MKPQTDRALRITLVEAWAAGEGHQTWFTAQLANELCSAKVDTHLVTFEGLNPRATDSPLNPAIRHTIVTRDWPMNRALAAVRMLMRGSRLSWPPRRLKIWLKEIADGLKLSCCLYYVRRAGALPEPDAIHVLSPPSRLGVLALTALTRRRTPYVISLYGGLSKARPVRRAIYGFLRNIPKCTLVAQTATVAKEWASLVGASRVRHIPLGSGRAENYEADDALFRAQLGIPPKLPIVSLLGHMSPDKGYEEFIGALGGMAKEFFVLIAGKCDSTLIPRPDDLITSIGWGSQAKVISEFLNKKVFDEAVKYSTVVVLLYRAPEKSSGLLSLCQQFRTPVLANEQGELGRTVAALDMGLTVALGDTDSIRSCLRRMANGQEQFYRRAQNVNDPTGAFLSWQEMANRYRELYANMAGSAAR